jgi:hypothetical protein
MENGDLEGFIDKRREEKKLGLDINYNEHIQYAIDVAKGMAWLSQRGVYIIHYTLIITT